MKSYFRGWYYKIQSDTDTIAFIPSINIDERGQSKASIQIVTPEITDCAKYNFNKFRIESKRGLPFVRIEESSFSINGLSLNINTGSRLISGKLDFINPVEPSYDIMGPFAFVPFMECRHSIFSLLHSVNGSVVFDGRRICFDNALGYIEGDRGHSFPKEYLWTQYISRSTSIMLSVADIPLIGKRFTGIIGALYFGGREYRIATYLGAKPVFIGDGKVTVRQGAYTFSAELLGKGGHQLLAPVNGSMARLIKENISCPARYRFMKNNIVLFDFETDSAGFEYEYKR